MLPQETDQRKFLKPLQELNQLLEQAEAQRKKKDDTGVPL